MKPTKILALGLICAAVSANTQASTFLAEVCWNIQHPDGDPREFRVALSHVSGLHLSTIGVFTHAASGSSSPVFGALELVDGAWEMSLTRTDVTENGGRVRQFHFDFADGLSYGTAAWVGHNADNLGNVSHGSGSAPFVAVACPGQPQAPQNVDITFR